MTSHAAVVARGMGKICVVGAKDIEVDPAAGRLRANGRVVKKGQVITVDGTTGRVLLGAVKLVEPKLGAHYTTLMAWADQRDRKSTRLNSSHLVISYAVFCLKKKKPTATRPRV